MKVVLDTNSLIVSIGRQSKYRPIFDAFLNGDFTLLVSNDILFEYTEILELRTNKIVASNLGNFLVRSPDTQKVNIYFKWAAVYADADDNKFVDCALNGNADFLVTDDKHFKLVKDLTFPRITVLKTAEFLKLLNEVTEAE